LPATSREFAERSSKDAFSTGVGFLELRISGERLRVRTCRIMRGNQTQSEASLPFAQQGIGFMDHNQPVIRKLQPEGATVPVSAFSHGILVPLPGADLLFVSGQIAVDKDRSVVAPNNPEVQAEVVFGNIARVLQEAGLGFEHVVKAQLFLTDMKHLPLVTAVRDKYFAASKPVSTLVEVSRLVRDGCCLEVEVMAIRLHRP
jgi:2-iminobutanoate/2-iminopropanoate deaminase